MSVYKDLKRIDVSDFCDIPKPGIDNTAGIEEAVLLGAQLARPVFFPSGRWEYHGQGFDPLAVGSLSVEGTTGSSIDIKSNSYLFDVVGASRGLRMRRLSFTGGKGILRQTGTNSFSNQAIRKVIQGCFFKGYSECAISSNSADWGNWRIDDCEFVADNSENTIGIALNDRANNSHITRTIFHTNRFHIKLRSAGSEVHIDNCGFQWSEPSLGVRRSRIWLVPESSGASDIGENFTLTNSRFGSENWDTTTDTQILIAEELGADNATAMPELNVVSTKRVDYAQIHTNVFSAGGGTPNSPLIYSTTNDVGPAGFSVYSNEFKGSRPGKILGTLSGSGEWSSERLTMYNAAVQTFYRLEPPVGGGPAIWV